MLSEEERNRKFADLYAPLNNLMFYEQSFDITAKFSYIESIGKRILLHNMWYYKKTWKLAPFDQDNPYEDYNIKNMYFSCANGICQKSLWASGLYNFVEKYYQTMLLTIKQFEKDQAYNFNKGIVYANLGIAQAIQLRIDEGFANILKALDEDRGYFAKGRKPDEEFFESPLFQQLEKIIILDSLTDQIKILKDEGETFSTAEDFLKNLSDPNQRVFFEYTYAKINENYSVFQEKNNTFSANRLIVYLQDMCLFAEDFLKKKGHTGMLNALISSAFPGINLDGCGAQSNNELNEKIKNFYAETDKKKRALRILLTLRNFSSHNISSCISDDFIPENFSKVFLEVIRAIMYIDALH